MTRAAILVSAIVFSGASAFAADQTWTGKISDDMCGANHGGKPDRECTQSCVKDGSKYVFVAGDKVYKIANQDDKALATHAGHTVNLTGEMKGDTITVSKIEMPSKK